MRIASIIDNNLASPHGNRQGLSYGELGVLLLTYIVREEDHKICCLEKWLSQVWWVKCILRYIPPSEGVERTTKTQRTQRSIDPM
ncbi:hypothetical protein NIES3804_08980 [Microcystis aeruginosa NIES-3804]|uniref:Transposase n=1 Tax=Microcystis aeruginosa NIES-3804 TaxID=2517783 RepID=A0A6H9GGH7_MICAE|nr:hypothetical protein NIES3804_08980 [Microcystis aeruginosa NIES-3804]